MNGTSKHSYHTDIHIIIFFQTWPPRVKFFLHGLEERAKINAVNIIVLILLLLDGAQELTQPGCWHLIGQAVTNHEPGYHGTHLETSSIKATGDDDVLFSIIRMVSNEKLLIKEDSYKYTSLFMLEPCLGCSDTDISL